MGKGGMGRGRITWELRSKEKENEEDDRSKDENIGGPNGDDVGERDRGEK